MIDRQELANAFLDDSKHAIMSFCQRHGIPCYTCPNRFWIWVYGIRAVLPESTEEERQTALHQLARSGAYLKPDGSGVVSPIYGDLLFPEWD